MGAGCNLPTTPISQPINEAFPDRPISQLRGFGEIPDVPTPALRPGTRGSVRLMAALPQIPTNVTVLRVNDGRPDQTLLRNASNALGLPSGVLGETPVGKDLSLTWKDADGVHWNAFADGRRVTFSDEAHPPAALTVSALPSNEEAIRIARTFLQDHGVNMTRYSQPYVDPDWSAWWESQKTAGHCMDTRTLAAIRALSASLSWEETSLFPPLPSTNCVQPEFPSRMIVNMNLTQDGQGIFEINGAPRVGARVLVDVASGRASSGFFVMSADPKRSDYPGITQNEARDRMVRGGQGGTPNGDVTIRTIRFEWFPIEDTLTPPARFLYPALVGDGTIEYADGTAGPYRIVVPLVQ